ncbi:MULTISPECIES: Ger(x)C family spore germination protein [Paenibacillus]|uniref:Ger(X)C family spore germination protein n=1 Tax=Paenibacillus urinalis TaxID=521520 RepID=A0ABY7X8E2_9BACL|nr:MULTISPECIES: Ger(x)C family spore germination protein [Paenibacillus]WDI02078.1 Ger(x)C family spore germination protein [Paenibacillus urinalis]
MKVQGKTNRKDLDMKRKLLLITVLTLVSMILTSCWDAVELKDRLILSGFAMDRGNAKGVYEFSFQGVVSNEVSGSRKIGSTPSFVFSDQGRTLQEVVSKMSQKIPRRSSCSHAEVVIISEDLARDVGIGRFIDLIERDPETRITMQILIARGSKARDVLAITSPVSPITANNIAEKVRFASKQYSHNFSSEVDETIRGMIVPGGGPTISGVVIKGDKSAGKERENTESSYVSAYTKLDGMAMFKGDKLVGWMEGDEPLGLAIIKNRSMKSMVNLSCHIDPAEVVGIEAYFYKSSIKASVVDGVPHFHIDVKQEGTINEVTCPLKLDEGEVVEIYERTWSEKTKEIVMSAVTAAQKAGTDVLGFGYVLEKNRSPEYKQWEDSDDWSEKFSQSKVEVDVKTVIMNTLTRTNPYSSGGED